MALGDRVLWLADRPDPDLLRTVTVALVFWPRREIREAALDWGDLPSLRLVQAATAGLNHIGWRQIPADVQVAAAPGATGPFIAEYVLGVVLAWARGLCRSTRQIAAGHFDMGAPTKALRELSVGLVGFGGIGQATARLLAGLGCTVRAVNRSGEADPDAVADLEWLGTMERFQELLGTTDVVVLCVPYTTATDRLVDAAALAAMTAGDPDDRLLVNVARGPVVDEDALHDWLQADPDHHAAALDVWWRYPRDGQGHPFHRPFHTLPNVIMTPHNSPNVAGFRQAMVAQAARQVAHYLRTGDALHVHDAAWYDTPSSGDERA